MAKENEGKTADARAARLMQVLLGEQRDTQPAEELLWAYALNILEPDEMDRAGKIIAASPAARERLDAMRKCMAGGARAGVSPAYRAWALMRRKISELGMEISSINAAIMRTAGGLARLPAGGETAGAMPAPVPVVLGGKKDAESGAASGGAVSRIEVERNDGWCASLIHVPPDSVDIHVKAPEAGITGWVGLKVLLPVEGGFHAEETGIRDRLRNGRAQLPDCPDGVVKLMLPGAADMILCTTSQEVFENDTA